VKDSGTYTCRAFNHAGSIKCSASLIVKSMLISTTESLPLPLLTQPSSSLSTSNNNNDLNIIENQEQTESAKADSEQNNV
jgi:hypothetical protein